MTPTDHGWVLFSRSGCIRRVGGHTGPVLNRNDGTVMITTPLHGECRVFLSRTDDARTWAVGSQFAATAASVSHRAGTTTALRPGTTLVCSADGELSVHRATPRSSPSGGVPGCSLEQAMGWLDHGLRTAATEIASSGRPIRLLLSGGVDSGLLASYLWRAGADVRALTLRTPWGDEIDGASRTARHVGLPLDVIDVTAQESTAAIYPCMQHTQSDDAEVITVHLLVTVAFELARACGADLVTGLGSDLLNAGSDFGMGAVASDLNERIDDASASGMMVTGQFTPGPRMYHPYWSPALLQIQQSVPAQLKTVDGIEKYYLRELAAYQLPRETAFGRKVAIHQGAGLSAGLDGALGEQLAAVCARIRAQTLDAVPLGNHDAAVGGEQR